MADTSIPEYKPPSGDKPPQGRPAPKGGSKGGKAKRTPPKPTMPIDEIRQELLDFFIGTGLIALTRNEVDGIIIIGGAPDTVDAWCGLAEKNPYVHMTLQKLCTTSDLAKVLGTTIPLVLALANNHGVNVPSPRPLAYYKKRAEEVIEEQELADADAGENGAGHPASSGAAVS